MSRSLDEMALRKQVLQARSTLHRLQIQRDFQAVGDSLGWLRTGMKAVTSLSIRTGLLGLALRRVTGSPVGQAVALSSGVLLLAKVASLLLRLVRGADGTSPP